jgi:NTP pyrophosphatase (non-canonical NTP hydrolase)
MTFDKDAFDKMIDGCDIVINGDTGSYQIEELRKLFPGRKIGVRGSLRILPVEGPRPDDYQKLALRTEKTPAFIDPAWAGSPENAMRLARILHGLLGCMTELGEAADIIKRHLIYGASLDLTHLMEEAGDKQWYIALILDASGFTMEAAQARNIAKLRARYPEGFTEEKALTRDLEFEKRALGYVEAERAALGDEFSMGLAWEHHRPGAGVQCPTCNAEPGKACT